MPFLSKALVGFFTVSIVLGLRIELHAYEMPILISKVADLQVRDSPSISAKVVAKLPKGGRFFLADCQDNMVSIKGVEAAWCAGLTSSGVAGWIFSGLAESGKSVPIREVPREIKSKLYGVVFVSAASRPPYPRGIEYENGAAVLPGISSTHRLEKELIEDIDGDGREDVVFVLRSSLPQKMIRDEYVDTVQYDLRPSYLSIVLLSDKGRKILEVFRVFRFNGKPGYSRWRKVDLIDLTVKEVGAGIGKTLLATVHVDLKGSEDHDDTIEMTIYWNQNDERRQYFEGSEHVILKGAFDGQGSISTYHLLETAWKDLDGNNSLDLEVRQKETTRYIDNPLVEKETLKTFRWEFHKYTGWSLKRNF